MLKRRMRLREFTFVQVDGADGIPRVGATFARVQMAASFARQLPIELFAGAGSVARGEAEQTAKPVQSNARKSSGTAGFGVLRRDAGDQLAFGILERVSCDVDGCRE